MKKQLKSIALIHGWAEGSWQARRFVECLQQNDLELITDPHNADIIVGHSAGCYLVPETKARLIVLIGLPYWPGKPLVVSWLEKLKAEVGQHRGRRDFGWFLRKLVHNAWYILSRPSSLYRFLKNKRLMSLPKTSTNTKVVLIRNLEDRFCTPKVASLLPEAKDYPIVELPGLHDDCWLEPQAYIEIIRKYADELA